MPSELKNPRRDKRRQNKPMKKAHDVLFTKDKHGQKGHAAG